MKRMFATLIVMIAATAIGTADDMTRSRNLSSTFPTNTCFLQSDGSFNRWSKIFDGPVLTGATLSQQRSAVTAANNLATITATVTLQKTTGYDVTGAAITNAEGDVISFVTNCAVAITPNVATNAVVIITGGAGCVTNTTITTQSTTLY